MPAELMKKLTVIDQTENPIYSKGDFHELFRESEIEIIRVPDNKKFDGSVLKEASPDTTHLLMRVIDKLDKETLKRLPNLKYVGITSTGWWDEYFDQKLLKKKKVVVTNNPIYAREAVAEAVFATLLAEHRRLFELPRNRVTVDVPFGNELANKTIGIVGLGKIGLKVAEIALGFDMNVIFHDKIINRKGKIKYESLLDLLGQCDVISLHVPKSAGIIITAKGFQKMKPTAVIVNSAGTDLIDVNALGRFLSRNKTAAYIDISYPDEEQFGLLKKFPNAYLYPLFSNQTHEANEKKRQVPIENLAGFLARRQAINRVI